ncbi:MAG TPA: response regulator, partial [Bacteroidota bacterium]
QFPKYSAAERLKILIVDDESMTRVVHSRYVKRVFPSATIMCAKDGKEALELTQTFHPTVIISDYAMPEMDGFEFINACKKIEAVRSIPVIVITGEDSAASKSALLLAGADAVINKPIAPETLHKVLQDTLSRTSYMCRELCLLQIPAVCG